MTFFKKRKNFNKRKENLLLVVVRYWRIGVCSMFVMLLVSAFIGYFFFQKVNDEFLPNTESASYPQAVKKERIDRALQYFSDREEASRGILYYSSSVIDPSI